MTKNKYLLTSKNQHFIANHSIRDDVLKRYGEIIRNENKPEDNCPFDICCDDCKYFIESHGCSLAYKEGGGNHV